MLLPRIRKSRPGQGCGHDSGFPTGRKMHSIAVPCKDAATAPGRLSICFPTEPNLMVQIALACPGLPGFVEAGFSRACLPRYPT